MTNIPLEEYNKVVGELNVAIAIRDVDINKLKEELDKRQQLLINLLKFPSVVKHFKDNDILIGVPDGYGGMKYHNEIKKKISKPTKKKK